MHFFRFFFVRLGIPKKAVPSSGDRDREEIIAVKMDSVAQTNAILGTLKTDDEHNLLDTPGSGTEATAAPAAVDLSSTTNDIDVSHLDVDDEFEQLANECTDDGYIAEVATLETQMAEIVEAPCVEKHIDYGHNCDGNAGTSTMAKIVTAEDSEEDMFSTSVRDPESNPESPAVTANVPQIVVISPTDDKNEDDSEEIAASQPQAEKTCANNISMDISDNEEEEKVPANNQTVYVAEDMDESLDEIPETQCMAEPVDDMDVVNMDFGDSDDDNESVCIPETQPNMFEDNETITTDSLCDITVFERQAAAEQAPQIEDEAQVAVGNTSMVEASFFVDEAGQLPVQGSSSQLNLSVESGKFS